MGKPKSNASSLIDAYIKESPDRYRPLLEKIRTIIMSDKRIAEDWKWRAPNFTYQGMICWMAHFKGHIGINFFKGAIVNDRYDLFDQTNADAKGNRIIKIYAAEDINPDAIKDYIAQAIELNEKGLKPEVKKKEIEIPNEFAAALEDNPEACEVFNKFPDSYKRDYVEWIIDAKREVTRDKRIAQAIEWISEGKDRNWKYK